MKKRLRARRGFRTRLRANGDDLLYRFRGAQIRDEYAAYRAVGIPHPHVSRLGRLSRMEEEEIGSCRSVS